MLDRGTISSAMARLLAWIMEWQQGPGKFGGLYLHPCWGEIGVLERHYQGVTVSNYHSLIPAFLNLYRKTSDGEFLQEVLAMVGLLEQLQLPDGCFDHSVHEGEPGRGTVICNALADLGLLHMVEYTENKELKERILGIVRRNLEWFGSFWWQRGNAWKKEVDYPAWCAVTNQDLSVAYAMLKYGQLSGDMDYFDLYGKPATLWILENAYHPDIGMFDRGDAPDFLERVGYCGIIDLLLLKLNKHLKEEGITEAVLHNLDGILECSWRDEYGCLRLPGAFGLDGRVETKPSDVLGLVNFIGAFDTLAGRYGIQKYEGVREELLHTMMSYQSEFGEIRGDAKRKDIIDLVPLPGNFGALSLFASLWQGSSFPEVERPDLNLVISPEHLWVEDRKSWLIRDRGRIYSGVKRLFDGIYRENQVEGLEEVSVDEGRVRVVLDGRFKGDWISVELVGEVPRSVSLKGIKRDIKLTCKGGKAS